MAHPTYKSFIAVEEAILNDLRDKVEKKIGTDGSRLARDAALSTAAREWNSYVSGLGSVEMFTKLTGHPVSGSTMNTYAGLEKYGTALSGSMKGGAPSFTYLLYFIDRLDELTSGGDPSRNIPYWYIINWGSGPQYSGPSLRWSYTTRKGEPTSITKSYGGRWYWWGFEGAGDRRKGFIIPESSVGDRRGVREMTDYPAGHVFDHAADAFINRFRRYMETGG